jgi:hypothetical protein
MDFANTNKVLRNMAVFQANQMRINLGAKVTRKVYRSQWQNGNPKNVTVKTIRANHIASGQLVNSIKPTYENGEFGVSMLDYGFNVNDGRDKGKGIPPDVMLNWTSVKGIRPRNLINGQFIKNTMNNRKAMAFCMNRKIKFFGIEAFPFIDMSVDVTEEKFENDLNDALENDVYDYVKKIFKE